MQVTAIDNKEYNNSFSSLYIFDKDLRYSVWKNANKKQQEKINLPLGLQFSGN